MKKRIIALCFTASLCVGNPPAPEQNSPSMESLRQAYAQNKAPHGKAVEEGAGTSSEESGEFYPLAKHLVREFVINYTVTFATAKILGQDVSQKQLVLGALLISAGIRIPPVLDMMLRALI